MPYIRPFAMRRRLTRIRYFSLFLPLRVNLLLLLGIGYAANQLLRRTAVETSSYYGLALLMARIVLVFAGLLVAFALFSTLIAWVHFLLRGKERALRLESDAADQVKGGMRLRTVLPGALRPFLGQVRVRLYDKEGSLSGPLLLSGKLPGWFAGLSGQHRLDLPAVKEYRFSRAVIQFGDLLNLFSLAVQVPVHQPVVNQPRSLLRDTPELPPRQTEDETVRIDQLRRVEGEYLNYKKFEDSDDVRRIVWKIFAKNRELVVRVPEVMDPFASHLLFFASFYSEARTALLPDYHEAMLSHYKNVVWTLFDALGKKEFEVRLQPDQECGAEGEVQTRIARMQWHRDLLPSHYFKPRKGTVLCLHSFSPPEDVQQLLSACESGTTVFFVRLSRTFRSLYLLNWISRILFRPPSGHLQRLKARWMLLPLRYQTVSREKKLRRMLEQYPLNIEVI